MSGPAARVVVLDGDADLADVLRIRTVVFVKEQGVTPEEEIDGRDPSAVHLLATAEDGAPAGTCRLLGAGEPVARIGRMAVLAPARGSGIGARLLAAAEEHLRAAGTAEVVLDAQLTARAFYERAGYRAEGGTFLDAGIEHVRMRKRLAG